MSDAVVPQGRLRSALAVCMALALGGCALGPDYQRPSTPLDASFIRAGAPAGVGEGAATPAAAAVDVAAFWRGFGDPQLTSLVDRAVAANGDVRLAQARLQEARANQGEVDAAARPGFGVEAGVTRSVTPSSQRPGATRSERTGTTYDAGFVALWELDLFGRYRRGSEAAAALTEASSATLDAVHVSVAAEVARNYLELRGLQQRLRIAEAALTNQREALRITEARFEAGRGTQLDRERAATLVASTDAALPALQSAIERTVFRIATLVARPPRELMAELTPAGPLPSLPFTDLSRLSVGTPEQWLQRRPDLIAAERELAAATAGIGIARTELFPRLSLSGLLGLSSGRFSDLARSQSVVNTLGVGLSWTPFDLGAIRSRIGASEARAQQGLARYEQAVSLALEETEGAFSAFSRSAQRAERQARAAYHAEEAARLARTRYSAGVADFAAVLDAEREVLGNQDSLMQAQTATAVGLVAVYRTLGGGWHGAAGSGGLN